jgi:hypothetical protein
VEREGERGQRLVGGLHGEVGVPGDQGAVRVGAGEELPGHRQAVEQELRIGQLPLGAAQLVGAGQEQTLTLIFNLAGLVSRSWSGLV